MDLNIRLECLRLAVAGGGEADKLVVAAESYCKFLLDRKTLKNLVDGCSGVHDRSALVESA